MTIGNHAITGIILGRLQYPLPQGLSVHGECICTIAQLTKIRKFEEKMLLLEMSMKFRGSLGGILKTT